MASSLTFAKSVVLGLSLCIFSLQAQTSSVEKLFTMDLESLLDISVATANKSIQKSVDAAAVIEIISRQDIQNFGANSLLEVLDRATSVAMSGTFFFPQNTASMRGGVSTGADHHVLLLLNGRPMRDSFTGGENFAFYTAFPIQLIKQIEIVRGPGSVLYGSNAFNGVINIITDAAGSSNNQIKVTAGSFDTTKVDAARAFNSGKFKLSTGLHYLKETGWQHKAVDNNSVAGQFNAGEENLGLVATANYGQLNLNGFYIKSAQDFWGATSTWSTLEPVPTSELRIKTTRTMLDLGYQFSFSDKRFLDTNLSYNSQDFTHINYDSQSKNTFAEATHHWWLSENINWIIGTTAWYQDVNSFEGARVAPVPGFSQTWWSLYSQIEYQQTQALKWSLGAQINKVPKVDANSVPRLGLIYQFSDHSGIKANYGKAFRAAYGVETHFDLVICCREDGSNRGGLRGNPQLEPETIATSDVQFYWIDSKFQFNLTGFYSSQKDLVERERAADRVLDFLNRGELKVKGVELEYKHTFSEKSQLVTSYSYQQNKTGTGIDDFTLAPNSLFKIGMTHHFDNGIHLSAFNSYFGKSKDNQLRYPNRVKVNPNADKYQLLTANLSVPLALLFDNEHFGFIELYGYNLLDEAVYQPEVAGGQINTNPLRAGRSWYLTYTQTF